MPTIEAEAVRTRRLRLRPLSRSDAAEIAAASNDRDLLSSLSFLPHPLTSERVEHWIDEQSDSREWLVACQAETHRIVGVTGIHPAEDGGMEIGFWIGRDHWGCGYASEIAEAVARIARERGNGQVWAVVLPDNAASIRVLEKTGFIRDGEARRWYRLRGTEETVHRYRWPDVSR